MPSENPNVDTIQLQVLLDRANGGNSEARSELLDQSYSRMLRIAHKHLERYSIVRGNGQETNDVLHDAYVRINRALDELRPATVRQLMGLVALQTKRVLLDAVRVLRRRPSVGPFSPAGASDSAALLDPPAPPDPTGFPIWEVLELLDRLPTEEREIVESLILLELPAIEVAALLGISDDTVRRRWSRARVKLANLME
ncbi:MAG: sigma-70 family RNA polymerase sigma factor [Planctomycetia bacterium]|nr:sigma-70 family RNA polymerase sigma factor [Planctomycetia bacterium]